MNKVTGFTLLEMLIAIAIFATLSLGAYEVLNGVLRSDEISEDHSVKLKRLQRTFTVLERDFEQIAARSVRVDGEAGAAPFRAGKFFAESEFDGVTFVRLGWRNPQGQLPRSGLQQVTYIVRDEKLIRQYYLYPDPVVGAELREEVLVEGVLDFTLSYFKGTAWLEKWTDKTSIPKGVKLAIDLEGFGKITRVFILSQGVLPTTSTSKIVNSK